MSMKGRNVPHWSFFFFFFLGVPLPCTVKMSAKHCQSIFVYIVRVDSFPLIYSSHVLGCLHVWGYFKLCRAAKKNAAIRIRTKIIKAVCFASFSSAYVYVCVYVCVCTRSTCREQLRLQITGFSSSTHSLGFGGFFISPLSTLMSTFVQRLCHTVLSWSLRLYHTFFSFPPSLICLPCLPFIPCSATSIHLCPQEPQTTVIHNPVDGTKVLQRPVPPTCPVSSLPYSFDACLCASESGVLTIWTQAVLSRD